MAFILSLPYPWSYLGRRAAILEKISLLSSKKKTLSLIVDHWSCLIKTQRLK